MSRRLPSRVDTARKLDDWGESSDDFGRYDAFYEIILAFVEGDLTLTKEATNVVEDKPLEVLPEANMDHSDA